MWIAINEFDHRILALLKQRRERLENFRLVFSSVISKSIILLCMSGLSVSRSLVLPRIPRLRSVVAKNVILVFGSFVPCI